MKTILIFIIGLSLLFNYTTGVCNNSLDDQTGAVATGTSSNTITVISSQELNNLTTMWAQEFGRFNPSVKFNLAAADQNPENADLSFITNERAEARQIEKKWRMVVGRDAIVLVINTKNPMRDQINSQGISAEELAQLLASPEKRNWNSLLNGGQNAPVNCYLLDNEKVNLAISNFTTIDNASGTGNKVATSSELISTLQKDLYAIGICKLTDVRDTSTNELLQGLMILPIDKNRNGRIDRFESIYSSMDAFVRGVWIGKYPHALCGSIYASAPIKPTDKNTVAFLTWITTDGQKYLNSNGYSDLASREVRANIADLAGTEVAMAAESTNPFRVFNWVIVTIIVGISGFVTFAILRMIKKQKREHHNENIELTPVLDEDAILAPKGLYFDKSHTWAFMEEDGNVKVGVDDFLQHITGTITRIAMKNPGESIRKGEKILTIVRDGKQLDLYAPISGVIKEKNKILASDASLINSAPFTDGWVYLIEPKNWLREIQFLFMAEKYKEWLSDEFSRLKDFFAASVRSNKAVYAHIILQDGGELTDNVLADMGPEVWEDFQTKFVDASR